MKKVKPVGFFVFGILAVVLAGCFNPISVVPPKSAGTPPAEPFSVDILIGNDTQARSVAGPSAERIKGSIRNIIQLVVTDNSGNIVAFDEDRRASGDIDAAELRIDSLPFGQTYHFLLLMGHWERDYVQEAANNDGKYVYKEGLPPTLLAAGLKEQYITGSGKVTVTMWPIVVDTVFTTDDPDIPSDKRTAAPAVNAGKPGTVNLFPVNWDVTWTVRRGNGGNGFEELVKAQNAIPEVNNSQILLKSGKTIVRGEELSEVVSDTAVEGNVIALDIGHYTSGITRVGKGGSANFKLEYVPYNLRDPGKWAGIDETVFDLGDCGPVWIIRNGVNDLAQNNQTDFENLGKNKTTNGNGAVSFVIAADNPVDPEDPQPGDLVIKDGIFEGPVGADNPAIGFTTAGYNGTAGVYYAIVAAGTGAPGYSAYTKNLGAVMADTHTGKTISLPGPGDPGYRADKNYDIYVLLLKGGKVSAPIVINTTAGSGDVDWEWGAGMFLAIGNGGEAAISDDSGETWTKTTVPVPKRATGWCDAAYGNGVIVLVTGVGDDAVWSDDRGETWHEATLPMFSSWRRVVYGNGVFVAVGATDGAANSKAAWSDDGGKTWNEAILPSSGRTNSFGQPISDDRLSLAYGNGVFLTIIDQTDIAAWSANGKTWNRVTMPSVTGNRWMDLAYGDGVFVALIHGINLVARSTNGMTWETVSYTTFPNPWYNWRIIYGGGVFVMLDIGHLLGSDDKISRSTDGGKTWTSTIMPFNGIWYDAVYGNGVFMVAAGEMIRSTDGGKTWNVMTLPSENQDPPWSRIVYIDPEP
ncbi:MAG: hypothetical protein LBH57_06275 [Treponema sp.]|jgi:hypothetical protein|nr:hypothetical protein [Treponema sp.]